MHPLITGLTAALDYWQRGEPVALATVVEVIGSAPAGIGASVLVDAAGAIAAGITAGCVESHIVTAAAQVLRDQVPVCKEFDYDADAPLQPVPACGGRLRVLLEPVDTRSWPDLPATVDLLRTGDAAALVVELLESERAVRHLVVTPTASVGGLSTSERTRTAVAWVRDRMAMAASDSGSAAGVGIQGVPLAKAIMVPPRWRLLIVGAVEYGRMLSPLAQSMGFDVTVCDARPAFLTPERFPGATLVRAQPGAWLAEHAEQELTDRTAVCVLSHDPRIDVPATAAALRSAAAYVGALGSRATHADRERRLRAIGFGDEQLARLRAPIGLDLQASTPAETALAILAEVMAVRGGGSGRPLTQLDGPIHQRPG